MITRYEINPNVRKSNQLKFECHKLIEQIWGSSNLERTKAYKWLNKEFKRDIHFSTLEDTELLYTIWAKLWALSFKVDDSPFML